MSDRVPRGIVHLVGAGPGDPGLLTRRGAELLARADVVIYDRLVDPALLELAPLALHVSAAGLGGQDATDRTMIEHASAGRCVVRLKGGDPFVFGRGGEEVAVLDAAGLRWDVVPGVTSAVAAPAAAGIALTHRAHGTWVAIATGHDPSALDWDALASAPTVVFLMGVRSLGELAGRLIAAGRDAATPAAVIASATTSRQRVVRATLGSIAGAAADVEPPAVIVVGATAAAGAPARPLDGTRVMVLRAPHQSPELASLLRANGAIPVEVPAIRVTGIDGPRPQPADWWVFTSANAVRYLWSRLRDARELAGAAVAAVGPVTAAELSSRGIRPDLVPEEAGGAGLAHVFPAGPGRIVLPRQEGAPADLPDALRAKGWTVDEIAVYRVSDEESSRDAGARAIAAGVDAVCFTSGSTVRAFVRLWGPPPGGTIVCCIGRSTAAEARRAGLTVDAEADEPTAEGLVSALAAVVGR